MQLRSEKQLRLKRFLRTVSKNSLVMKKAAEKALKMKSSNKKKRKLKSSVKDKRAKKPVEKPVEQTVKETGEKTGPFEKTGLFEEPTFEEPEFESHCTVWTNGKKRILKRPAKTIIFR